MVVFCCKHIGISGTTEVFARQETFTAQTQRGRITYDIWEARMGLAILGTCNTSDEERAACDHNPFHPNWKDNYAKGTGRTQEEAIEALKKDVEEMSNALWG